MKFVRHLITLFVLFLSTAAGPAAPPVVRFYVRLTTTSDWTRWKPESAVILGRAIAVEKGDDARIHAMGVENLALNQPLESRREVSALFEVFVTRLGGPLRFSLRKGDVGETRLELYLKRPNDGTLPDFTIENSGKVPGDPENPLPGEVSVDLTRKFETLQLPDLGYSKRVLAFYYPWYGNPDGPSRRWSHWDPKGQHYASRHTPKLGWYDSADDRIMKAHMALAKESGIHGFIASWWGIGSFEDGVMPALLKAAEQTHFSIAVYLERGDNPAEVAEEIEHIASHYGRSRSFLREEGKPVIFVYGRLLEKMDSVEKWQAVRDKLDNKEVSVFLIGDTFDMSLGQAFDGLHTYNPVGQPVDFVARGYQAVWLGSRVAGKLFAATVTPGYDDTFVRKPGMVVEREDGALYRKFWEAAIAARPDWILITSFNEWHEGSEIEPSKELGDLDLRLTREYAPRFNRR
ncbi:MAG: hypothetical protein ACREJQ_06335 [bacterium]